MQSNAIQERERVRKSTSTVNRYPTRYIWRRTHHYVSKLNAVNHCTLRTLSYGLKCGMLWCSGLARVRLQPAAADPAPVSALLATTRPPHHTARARSPVPSRAFINSMACWEYLGGCPLQLVRIFTIKCVGVIIYR